MLLTALAPPCLQTPKLSNRPHCSLISCAFTGDVSPMAEIPCRTMWRTSGSVLGSVGGFASTYLEGGRIKHVGQRTHIRISIISANQWAVVADDSGATPTAEER